MRYADASNVAGYRQWNEDPTQSIQITTRVFFQEGVGANGTCQVGPGGIPRAQSWVFGKDPGLDPPAFLIEAGILHALLPAEQ